jgi:serine/threonine protein kinase
VQASLVESDYETELVTVPQKMESASDTTPDAIVGNAREMQVACAFFGDAAGQLKRPAFTAMRVRIAEDRGNPFLKSLVLADCVRSEKIVPLRGALVSILGRIAAHKDDVQPSFAANSVGIRCPGSTVTWIFASPSRMDQTGFLDRLCRAGCTMDDLARQFTLLQQPDDLPRNLRLGRLTTSGRGTAKSDVVVKVASDEEKTKQLINEVQFLLNLRHDGIVSAYGLYQAKSGGKLSMGMLLDFKEEGDLESRIPAGGLPERMLRSVAEQICDAMLYLHESHLVVHRDIKPSNVLCERAQDGSVKVVVADFGVAAYVMDRNTIATRTGTAGFIAPEVLRTGWAEEARKASDANITKMDVYSLGVLLYTAAMGKNPFTEKSDEPSDTVLRRNAVGLAYLAKIYGRSKALDSFLSGLLEDSPSQRFSISEVLAHPWFSDGGGCCSNGELKHAKVTWVDFVEAKNTCRKIFRVLRSF